MAISSAQLAIRSNGLISKDRQQTAFQIRYMYDSSEYSTSKGVSMLPMWSSMSLSTHRQTASPVQSCASYRAWELTSDVKVSLSSQTTLSRYTTGQIYRAA